MRLTYRAAIFVALVLLGSCRTAPIYNANDRSFNNELTMQQATSSILRAGADLGWSMTVEHPGLIRGVLNLRSHQAVVDITYDDTTFSIDYVDSTDLNYNGTDIHRNYNGWVQNLEQRIRAEATVAAA